MTERNYLGMDGHTVSPKPRFDESDWRKASYSLGNGECIEVAGGAEGQVAVRDSKNPAGCVLVCSVDEWNSFLLGIKN